MNTSELYDYLCAELRSSEEERAECLKNAPGGGAGPVNYFEGRIRALEQVIAALPLAECPTGALDAARHGEIVSAIQPDGGSIRYEGWVVLRWLRGELDDPSLASGLSSAVRFKAGY